MSIRPADILITNNIDSIANCTAKNCLGGLIIGHHENPIGDIFALDESIDIYSPNKEALKFERSLYSEMSYSIS